MNFYKKLLDYLLLDIYEVCLALQGIPTTNHLEKLSSQELGKYLENVHDELTKAVINKMERTTITKPEIVMLQQALKEYENNHWESENYDWQMSIVKLENYIKNIDSIRGEVA